MGTIRKMIRNEQKKNYKAKNKKTLKRYRITFAEYWENYQKRKYGKDQYKLLKIINKKK